MEENEIIISGDGSHTIVSQRFGVTYHSRFGAIDEGLTVFISAGFHYVVQKINPPIRIVEMGFGTGLNALLTLIESQNIGFQTQYTGIEKYPISLQIASRLNYAEVLKRSELQNTFMDMHHLQENIFHKMTENFKFQKIYDDLLNWNPHDTYDVIYFDAFAPGAQEELWSGEVMKKMYSCLTKDGVLVTYCAKGDFKRALRSAGFEVESLPGPGKKREMTRAHKLI